MRKYKYKYRICLKELLHNKLLPSLKDLLDDINAVCIETLCFTQEKYIKAIDQMQIINEYIDNVEKAIYEIPKKKLCDLLKNNLR